MLYTSLGPIMTSILEHVSFSTLDESQKARVRAYAQAPLLSDIDTHEVFKNQYDMSMPLAFWDNQVNKLEQFVTTAADFGTLTPSEKTLLNNDLVFAFYIFNARYKLAFAEGLGHELDDHDIQIKKCATLINLLNEETNASLELPDLPTVSDNGIKNSLDWMGYWNERRLYWVWAGRGGLLGTTIGLLPDDFFYKTQALSSLDALVPLTGGLSWALYYFRCAIRLGLLIRHTFSVFCSEEEKKIPWAERFAMQLHKTKFDLINDFFWACGNLACFFWLCGAPVADYYGGAITTLLLLMDVGATIWAYADAHAQYTNDMKRFNSAIQALMENEALNRQQIQSLKYAERQCKIDWNYKLYSLYSDIMYAACLMLAFTLLYCGFLPIASIAAGTALFWGVTGTVLCFTLNSCFSIIRQGLDICNSVELLNLVAKDFAQPNQRAFDLQLLKSEWQHHQKIIEYKQARLTRSVLVDFLVPPVVFLALVFTPWYIGLPIVLAGFVLAVMSHYYIDSAYQHDITCLPKQNLTTELPNPVITHGFFGKIADVLRVESEPEIALNI